MDGPASALPSFTALRAQEQLATSSRETRQLFWTLAGDLATSIFIIPEGSGADPAADLEAYARQTIDSTVYHSLASAPLTNPPVSSIPVKVYQLEQWEDEWVDVHREDYSADQRTVAVGDDEQEDMDNDSGTPVRILHCCGFDRPPPPTALEVRASSAPYVTIHDYVTAVHPWLMHRRDDLLLAMNVWNLAPLPQDTALMVSCLTPHHLIIYERQAWIARYQQQHGHATVVTQNIPIMGPTYTVSS